MVHVLSCKGNHAPSCNYGAEPEGPRFVVITSVISLDARGEDGGYSEVKRPLLRPDMSERQTSLDRSELAEMLD